MARLDYQLIEALVPDGATVLDLGCGDGELLDELVRERHVRGSGVDIDERAIEACIRKGLSVFHGDLDEGLADYEDGSIDVVILSFSLQQLRRPRMVVREMARVGRLAVVSFPNFAHWAVRGQLLVNGRMPVSTELPYQWYDTPNIHLCTVKDFRDLCAREGLRIERESYLRSFDRLATGLRQPNLTARIAIFAFSRLPSVTEVAPPQV
jgi:methionine biosynthesis protein MetW